jgi:TetR/AcrR family acrAB operon transcriptional repressor
MAKDEGVSDGSASALYSSIFPKQLTKGERKKLEIIEAAAKLFAEKGVENTTYDDIAQALGTNRSHITYHFKERVELNLSVIRLMMGLAHEFSFGKLRQADSAKAQLIGYVESLYDFFVENPHWTPVFLFFYYAAGIPGEARALQTQIREQAHGRIQELIRNAHIETRKPVPRDLSRLAFQIQALLLGGMILNISTGETVATAAIAAQTKESILMGIERVLKTRLIGE